MYSPYKKKDLVKRKIEELWPGAIAYGFPVYVNGPTNLGKTTAFLKVGADVTRGIFPPGIKDGQLEAPRIGEPINVFYVSTENPVLEIVYPSLLYNGADMSRIKIQREDEAHFELCTDDLTAVMDDFAPRLIIIDAFQEHLPDGFDLSDGRSMSRLMRELEAFSYKHKIALVLIGNDSKGPEVTIHSLNRVKMSQKGFEWRLYINSQQRAKDAENPYKIRIFSTFILTEIYLCDIIYT